MLGKFHIWLEGNLRRGGIFFFMLFSFLLSLRLVEFVYVSYILKVNYSFQFFIYDVLYSCFLTTVFLTLITILLFNLTIGDHRRVIIVKTVWLIIMVTNMVLALFYLSAGRLLGEELFNYNFVENVKITYTGFTYSTFIFLVLFVCVSCVLYKILALRSARKGKAGVWKSLASVLFLIVLIVVTNNNRTHFYQVKDLSKYKNTTEYYLGNSKLVYFVDGTLFSLSKKEATYTQKELGAVLKRFLATQSTGTLQYPFSNSVPTSSTLSPFFKRSETKPNIVIIIVESLSSAFSGNTNYLGSYTPFLDSLSNHSLYWGNCLSGANRTYGSLPNILVSLPYGKDARGVINDENIDRIKLESLISVLNSDYKTSFFYPGWGSFDQTEKFMKYLGCDKVVTERELKLLFPHREKYKWSYDDKTLYESSFMHDRNNDSLQIEVFLTLGIHNPYDHKPFEGESISEYLLAKNVESKKVTRKKIASSIHLSDDALQFYFSNKRKEASFENSIFIITGDHNIGADLPLQSPIEQYRVPLLIYSPLLKSGGSFSSVVSHRDIFSSLVGLLYQNFPGVIVDEDNEISCLGNMLDTSRTYQTKISSSLNLYSEKFPKIIHQDYFLLGDQLYQYDSLMKAKVIDNKVVKEDLLRKVEDLKILNDYTYRSKLAISPN